MERNFKNVCGRIDSNQHTSHHMGITPLKQPTNNKKKNTPTCHFKHSGLNDGSPLFAAAASANTYSRCRVSSAFLLLCAGSGFAGYVTSGKASNTRLTGAGTEGSQPCEGRCDCGGAWLMADCCRGCGCGCGCLVVYIANRDGGRSAGGDATSMRVTDGLTGNLGNCARGYSTSQPSPPFFFPPLHSFEPSTSSLFSLQSALATLSRSRADPRR